MKLKILFFLILSQAFISAQGVMKIETDKSNYSYGDSIEVKVTITNNSDTSFSIWGSSSCIVRIGFNSVDFLIVCTADNAEFPFSPHSSRTWIWLLEPSVLGIPDKNGEQKIYSYGGGLKDSIFITAPKYYGGRVVVGLKLGIKSEDMQGLRDSLNSTIIWSTFNSIFGVTEEWQIAGFSIDSLISVYSNDSRFRYIEINRQLDFKNVIITSAEKDNITPKDFVLYQNYPNPFNPATIISYTIPAVETGYIPSVQLKIFDVLGREVATLVNEEKTAGNYEVKFDASNLPSGIYFYRITAVASTGSATLFSMTKKMVLLR